MRQLFSFLLFGCYLIAGLTVNAQQCNGSLGAPVINYTFGHGTGYSTGGPLTAGITNMAYTSDVCGTNDGQYTITNNSAASCKGGTWLGFTKDHTGDPFGYLMLINASVAPSVFYTQRIDGSKLCPGATYYFGAWIANLLRDLPSTKNYSKPNITFSIEKLDGTPLAPPFNSGNIDASPDVLNWVQYGTLFAAPADGSDFIVKMTNNAPGNDGNDLVLDDITVSPCGPLIQTGFTDIGNITPKTSCPDLDLSYTLVSKTTGYKTPAYQWQYKIDADTVWHNVNSPDATTAKLTVNIPHAAGGVYEYRIGVLDGGNTSESCRIYSDPLTITVYSDPVNPVSATTSACVEYPLQLSATGGDTYSWTGPNGFKSTQSNPTITPSATLNDKGEYDVTITKNGCPTFAKTTVTVYPVPTVAPIQPLFICEGTSQQIITNAANTTHYKWTPSTGLDHDDVANPIASPVQTTTYQLAVSNDGCSGVIANQSVTVTVWKKPQANAGQTIKIFAGQTAKLNGIALGDHVHSYWTPYFFLDNSSSLTPITSTPQDITYTLHVISDEGCGESTSDVFVRVYQQLTIPNTFTPNGDGVNDKWEIKNLNTYPNALLSIYNRNGQPVFQNKGGSSAWDGTYNGSPLPVGTYYYVIDLQDDDLPKPAGWVLIVR
jgi:gliding motility-associated-like protein